MPQLSISLKIPFECNPSIGLMPALTFSHWLPMGDKHAIYCEEGDIRLKLWFDEKCTWWASQPTADELKSHHNVLAHRIYVDIEVTHVSEDLAAYIQSRDYSRKPMDSEKKLQDSYLALGEKILSAVLKRINRLIAFARAKKGQYWITELEFDAGRLHSFFNQFEARARLDDGKQFRFQPAAGDQITISMGDDSAYIKESEWIEFHEYVRGTHKPALVGELLAGAEYLLKVGHPRSALTEAVTALEVALHSFARNPAAETAFGKYMAGRIATSSLKSQVQHFGLSGSISYLIPTIIPDNIMPTDVLQACQGALTQRQNVVHNGQRDVNEAFVNVAIANIRKFCEILSSITDESIGKDEQ